MLPRRLAIELLISELWVPQSISMIVNRISVHTHTCQSLLGMGVSLSSRNAPPDLASAAETLQSYPPLVRTGMNPCCVFN